MVAISSGPQYVKISLKITDLKSPSNFPGANELTQCDHKVKPCLVFIGVLSVVHTVYVIAQI